MFTTLLAAPLFVPLLPVLAQDESLTPTPNDTATEPYWPQYPEGMGPDDFMFHENAGEDDLTGNSRIARWIIEASNAFRAQFNSQPVTWNETAARLSSNHTDTCEWEHWGSDNLAQQFGSDASMRFHVNPMIAMWADEWDYYPFWAPEEQAYSHFTAMVWDGSTTVGCAWNVNCANDTEWPSRTFFVCHYWPVGNIGTTPPGELYAENVQNFTAVADRTTSTSAPASTSASADATATTAPTGTADLTSGATTRPTSSPTASPNSGTSTTVSLAAVLIAALVAALPGLAAP